MAEPDGIAKEVQESVRKISPADIVVGIPSFNNAGTIGGVVRTVQQGLRDYFPAARSVIVNSDGGSRDGTLEQVSAVAQEAGPVLQVPYSPHSVRQMHSPHPGVPHAGSALRVIFQLARMLDAGVCAVVDPAVRSVAPGWIRLLVQPVFEGQCDFVAPCYLRHRFDGAINNGIVYPLTRALYGKRIRQPLGGECCFSRGLVEHYLAQDPWDSEAARSGIDIWVTTQAVCGGFRAGQAFLGVRIHDGKGQAADLSDVLAEVLGAMFAEMERNVKVWQRVRGSEAVPAYGEPGMLDAETAEVDVGRMIDSFDIGFRNLFEIWSVVMPPATLLELKKLARRANGEFRLPDDVWVHAVYDFAVAYHLRTISRDHLLRALTPLYLGWVGSFVLQVRTASAAQVEARIEELCLRYEAEKSYLIPRWRWPDRFNP